MSGVRTGAGRTAKPEVSFERAAAAYRRGRYEETVGHLVDSLQRCSAGMAESESFVLIVKALSNLRRWRDAQNWCVRAIEKHRLSVELYVLHATVLQELGDATKAERCLRSALYLDDRCVPAHFMLGVLHQQRGALVASRRHMGRALSALKARDAEELVAGTDGITVSQFAGMIETLTSKDRTAAQDG